MADESVLYKRCMESWTKGTAIAFGFLVSGMFIEGK